MIVVVLLWSVVLLVLLLCEAYDRVVVVGVVGVVVGGVGVDGADVVLGRACGVGVWWVAVVNIDVAFDIAVAGGDVDAGNEVVADVGVGGMDVDGDVENVDSDDDVVGVVGDVVVDGGVVC